MQIRVIKHCSFCLADEILYTLPCKPGYQVAIIFGCDDNHQCRHCQAFGYIVLKILVQQASPVVEAEIGLIEC